MPECAGRKVSGGELGSAGRVVAGKGGEPGRGLSGAGPVSGHVNIWQRAQGCGNMLPQGE